HVARPVGELLHAGSSFLQRGRPAVRSFGRAHRPAQKALAVATRPAGAAPHLGRWRYLWPAAPPRGANVVARVMVATLCRSGALDCAQHGLNASRYGLVHRRADVPDRRRSISPDLLVRSET